VLYVPVLNVNAVCAWPRGLLIDDPNLPIQHTIYGAALTIKVVYRWAMGMSNVRAFSEDNFYVPSETGSKMAVLGVKEGLQFKFWFCNLQNPHPCAEPRLLTYFSSKSVRTSWL